MGLLRIDGFDHQNNNVDLVADGGNWSWRQASGTTLTSPGLNPFGGKCVTVNQLNGTLTSPVTTAFFGFNININAGVNAFGLWLWNAAGGQIGPIPGTKQFSLIFNSNNGTIQAYLGNWAQGGINVPVGSTPNNTFTANTTFFFEMGVTISPSLGSVVLKINGATVFTYNGSTSWDGSSQFDSVGIGHSPGAVRVDDFYICDSSGSQFNTFIGPCSVVTQFPDANNSVTWSPLSATNFQMVDETAMDGDNTYNFSITPGQEDLFNINALPNNVIPIAAQVTGAYRQDGIGSRSVSSHLKSGTTDAPGTAVTLSASYVYQHDVFPTDPNNGPWTVSSINAAQIGYKLNS